MFRKLWIALAALINNAQSLADTFGEADVMAREKFGLPPRTDTDNSNQLDHKEEPSRKRLTKKGEDDV